MKKKPQLKEENRFCGNCIYHNLYVYPDQNFCFAKFQMKKNPVTSVLDCCSQWEYNPEECFCLDETLKKNANNLNNKHNNNLKHTKLKEGNSR